MKANAAAVAQLLGITEAEVQALAATEVFPKPKAGEFDALACVRAYGAHMRGLVEQRKITWVEARRRHEEDGATFTELGALLGVRRETVGARAKREGWIDRTEVAREARAAAIRDFVRQDAKAILENLAEKHAIGRDILALVRTHLSALREGSSPNLRAVKALKDLAYTVRAVEGTDAALAGLRDTAWRQKAKNPLADLPPGIEEHFMELLREEPQEEEQRA